MPNSLASPPVRDLLDRLFQAADHDDDRRAALAARHPGGLTGISAREQADAFAELYIPVSPVAGQLLYALARSSKPDTVVEFGTSFGISTIHLAAAVRDNGTGRVISTELSAAKAARARANIAEGRPGQLGHGPGRRRPADPGRPGRAGPARPAGRLEGALPPGPAPARAAAGAGRPHPGRRHRLHGGPDGRLPVPRPRSGPRLRLRRVPGVRRPGDQLPHLAAPGNSTPAAPVTAQVQAWPGWRRPCPSTTPMPPPPSPAARFLLRTPSIPLDIPIVLGIVSSRR